MALGEVVAVHIAHRLLRDGVYRTEDARTLLRAGGPADYVEIRPEALFQMHRAP